MENPFAKLVREGEEDSSGDYTRLTQSAEKMTSEDRQKRIGELKEWKKQVEAGMGMDPVSDDVEKIDMIDKEIHRLEQE